ncbi:Scr1 family TA system antitoxin-like transcriptional regulator [Pseudonocardia sp. ICBG601]|uniref:Scr1 family TA system antitoxin-like transcriptional regulator n=1 Tax=Pseudonocardia sp. ICBG601 TaxID=2846759 RepID=UPI001CF6EC7F|nr:Scr1 family TA system antitoxin-like transcriptional regulator [Pseudonocardia sp. ICBG601]
MSDIQSETRRKLGDLLRQHRLRSGISGRNLAQIIDLSQSKISRIETGRARISSRSVREWTQATGATTASRIEAVRISEGLERAEEEAKKALAETQEGGGRRGSRAALEASASEILLWQFVSVPELLQTVAYARALLRMSEDRSDRSLDTKIAQLGARQDILYRPSVVVKVVVSEEVLGAHFGDIRVTIDQLDKIASLARRRRFDLSVLPHGTEVIENRAASGAIYLAPSMNSSGFAVLSGAHHPEGNPAAVDRLLDDFSHYQRHSLRGDSAIALVEETARRLAANSCAAESCDGG